MVELTPDTKAILMLTAPLLTEPRSGGSVNPFKPKEYKRLTEWLRYKDIRPAKLTEAEGVDEIIAEFAALGEYGSTDDTRERLHSLLQRGTELASAVDRWNQRNIWVLGWSDPAYPQPWKQRLEEHSFPLLYGCGDPGLLECGGLAVVGSRRASKEALQFATDVGRLAARADCAIVSGGARGVDQTAMRGALEEGGSAVGILANELGRAAGQIDHLEVLREGRLVLACPWDPEARFQVWRAMQRNKLIYTLADAALVVAYEDGRGGTWSGATEQLRKNRHMRVYVRDDLVRKGAQLWPNPETMQAFRQLLSAARAPAVEAVEVDSAAAGELATLLQIGASEQPSPHVRPEPHAHVQQPPKEPGVSAGGGRTVMPDGASTPDASAFGTPAEELFVAVHQLVRRMDPRSRTRDGVREALGVRQDQAKDWWNRLVEKEVLRAFRHEADPKSAREIVDMLPLSVSPQAVQPRLRALVKEGWLLESGSRPVRYHRSEPGPESAADATPADKAQTGQRGPAVADDGHDAALAELGQATQGHGETPPTDQARSAAGEASQRTLALVQP